MRTKERNPQSTVQSPQSIVCGLQSGSRCWVSLRSARVNARCCRLIALLGLAVLLRSAGGQTLSTEDLIKIRFDQKLDSQISLNLVFQDEEGKPAQLSQFFGNKPVVLVLGYYQCPMLCTMVLNGMVESAADLKWSIGREFEVVNVSVNPNETPALAAAKKLTYLKRYGRAGATDGWHFLVGNEASIAQLAREVGFRYAYDPASKQYAHPSGLVILTPQGKVASYLFGVTYSPRELFAALQGAANGQRSSSIQQLVLLCFHYNPLSGKYSGRIMIALRILSVATILGCFGLILHLARRRKLADAAAPSEVGLTLRSTAMNLPEAAQLQPRDTMHR